MKEPHPITDDQDAQWYVFFNHFKMILVTYLNHIRSDLMELADYSLKKLAHDHLFLLRERMVLIADRYFDHR